MARYVIEGRRQGFPWCYYITRTGCLTTTGERAAVITTLTEAKLEVDYWRKGTAPDYRWFISKLPPRFAVRKAVLSAEEIDY